MLPALKPVSAAPAPCKICGGTAPFYGVTDAFDCWSDEQFKTHIYNDAYLELDLEYNGPRPLSNADVVARLWGRFKTETRVLDFGGGNDLFCERLRAGGFPVAVTYDPMVSAHARRPDGEFDLVTCFETLEHVRDPVACVAHIIESVADPGLVLYSTVVQPPDFGNQGLAWWYVGPRNGHISLIQQARPCGPVGPA